LGSLTGCKEEAKKDAVDAARGPEPIPSDFVVNGFFGGTDDQPPKVQVRGDAAAVSVPVDAAGGASASSDTDGGSSSTAANDAPAGPGVKVLEPGEEPRVVRKYDLKGKTENVTVTLRSTMAQEIPGQPAASQSQPGMVFALSLTPRPKTEGGDFPIKLVVSRAEVLPGENLDPAQVKQMGQAFKMLAGQAGGFMLSTHGRPSGFQMSNEQLARSELAALVQQTLEGLFVVLPDDPIGKGARWEEVGTTRQEGVTVTTTATYTLKDIGADGLAIGVVTKRKAPPQPVADPRAPKGTTLAIDGTATATVKVRLERMPGKGSVDSNTAIAITQVGPGGAKQTMQQKVSVKQTIDNSSN
jgi:hypothetical protein